MFLSKRCLWVLVALSASSTAQAFPVNNGQEANWRQGQTTWVDGFVDANVDPFFGAQPTSPTTMFGPNDVLHVAEEQLVFVADTLNRRVLAFDAGAGVTFQDKPLFVLGQPDMETGGANPRDPYGHSNTANEEMGCKEGVNACGVRRPFALAYDARNGRLFVADPDNRRVVVWDLSGGWKDGMPAQWVLGQKSMTTDVINGSCENGKESKTNPCGLGFPQGLAFDPRSGNLFVADSLSHRVVVFDTPKLESGMPAFAVIGQASLEEGQANAACEGSVSMGTNRCGLHDPGSLAFDANNGHLYISDFANHRVVRYDSFKDIKSSLVIGQQDYQGNNADAGCRGESSGRVNACGIGMFGIDVAVSDEALFITDSSNHRVLSYSLKKLEDGMPATSVLGQRDFETGFNGVEPDLGGTTSRSGLVTPHGLSFDSESDRLFVADVGNHRIMVFGANVDGAAVEAAGEIAGSETSTQEDGSVAIRFKNTMGDEIGIEFPAGTTGQKEEAIRTKVGYIDGDEKSPGIAIIASLPKGETKSVTMPVVGNRICVIDEEVAFIGAFPTCNENQLIRIPAAGECSRWKAMGEPGDNPDDPNDKEGWHVIEACGSKDGRSVTLSGLLHTFVGVVTVDEAGVELPEGDSNKGDGIDDGSDGRDGYGVRGGGCQTTGSGHAPLGLLLVIAAMLGLRRRRSTSNG